MSTADAHIAFLCRSYVALANGCKAIMQARGVRYDSH